MRFFLQPERSEYAAWAVEKVIYLFTHAHKALSGIYRVLAKGQNLEGKLTFEE